MDKPKTGQQQGSQMRILPEEIALIRHVFKGNEPLLKLLRKIFLPELDPQAPFGQMIDLWMTIPVKEMTPEQAHINILARSQLIMHVDQQLIQLKYFAESEETSAEEALAKLKKDSNK
jgi:hypothetical protein